MAFYVRRTQTVNEERANQLTHGFGAALSVAGLAIMVSYAATIGDTYRIVGAAVFGVCMVIVYITSTLYHSVSTPAAKALFRRLDHSAIYLMIAGTYTPFVLVRFPPDVGWTIFGIVWACALLGVIFKVYTAHRFPVTTVLLYLAMGWIAIFIMPVVIESVSLHGTVWVVTGGLAYSAGVLFYAWRALPYHHTIWHVFVMLGTVCHFFAVLNYVLPPK